MNVGNQEAPLNEVKVMWCQLLHVYITISLLLVSLFAYCTKYSERNGRELVITCVAPFCLIETGLTVIVTPFQLAYLTFLPLCILY